MSARSDLKKHSKRKKDIKLPCPMSPKPDI